LLRILSRRPPHPRRTTEVVQADAQLVRLVPSLRDRHHDWIVVAESSALHPVPEPPEVIEVAPDDGADLPGLFRGEIVRGHVATVPTSGGDDNR
jgi:hypothetical protein